jgi:hypothetical protein
VTDPTAAIEVWARMLCAADVHVYGADHPTWQQTGSKIRDDYRKAAAWLLPRLTVAAAPAGPAPATNRELRERIAEAVRDAACPGDCGKTEEECAKERIQPFAWHHGKLAVIEGTPEQIADAVLPLVPAPTDQTAAAAVRALHQPMQRGPFTICAHCSGWDGKWRCLGVVTDYPCPTVRALDGEPAREAQQDPTQDGEAEHTGGNAEDCPACRPQIDKTVLYPWICPGQPQSDEEALCVCGHGRAHHVFEYGGPCCRLCPERGEWTWAHAFDPVTPPV